MQPVSSMRDPVQDSLAQRSVPKSFRPSLEFESTCIDCRFMRTSIINDIQKIAAVGLGHVLNKEVIKDLKIQLFQFALPSFQSVIYSMQLQVHKEASCTDKVSRSALPDHKVCTARSDITLANTARTTDDQIGRLFLDHPLAQHDQI